MWASTSAQGHVANLINTHDRVYAILDKASATYNASTFKAVEILSMIGPEDELDAASVRFALPSYLTFATPADERRVFGIHRDSDRAQFLWTNRGLIYLSKLGILGRGKYNMFYEI